jgi:hypothetical protein
MLCSIWKHLFDPDLFRHIDASPRTADPRVAYLANNIDVYRPLITKIVHGMADHRVWDAFVPIHILLRIALADNASGTKSEIIEEMFIVYLQSAKFFKLNGDVFDQLIQDEDAFPLLCRFIRSNPWAIGETISQLQGGDARMSSNLLVQKTNMLLNALSEQTCDGITSRFYKSLQLGDFADFILNAHRLPTDAFAAFRSWAESQSIDVILGRFELGHGAYYSRVYDSLSGFEWSMLPSCWADNAAFTKKLLATVDYEQVLNIVRSHVEPGAVLNETLFGAMSQRKWTPADQHTLLFSGSYAVDSSQLPSFGIAMKAAFKDPKFTYMASCRPSFFYMQWEMCYLFAHAMFAYVDELGTCKEIITANPFQVKGKYLLGLLPKKIYDQIAYDKAFLLSIIDNYPGLGTRLPIELRYDEDFVIKTIECNIYEYFEAYDVNRIVKMNRVVDSALCHDETAVWMFKNLPTDRQETPNLVRRVMKDERLSLTTRRNIFCAVPEIIKIQKWMRYITTQLFGIHFNTTHVVDDPLVRRLLDIAHDNHSNMGGAIARNMDFLRSLLVDVQRTFMPQKIAERMRVWPPPVQHKQYFRVLDESYSAPENRMEALDHEGLKIMQADLEEVVEAASSIIEPRRRDGNYPSGVYCENFEGIRVKFVNPPGANDDPEDDLLEPMQLVTMSGKKVHVPPHWLDALEDYDGPSFFGKLHAGYGQRGKTVKLKNGTLGAHSPDDSDDVKARANAEWEGVVIKIYGLMDLDGKPSSIDFPDHMELPSFMEPVKPKHVEWENGEKHMLDFHRSSVAKGGLGVIFRKYDDPGSMISLDNHGYTRYVQDVVNFLHKYPMNVLETYMHVHDVEDEDEDMDAPGNYEPATENLNKVAEQVAAVVVPDVPSRKRSSAGVGRKATKQSKKSKQTSAAAAASSSTDPPPAAARRDYWDDDDVLSDMDDVEELEDVDDVEERDVSSGDED